jgi:hypothetical protein
MTNRLEIHGKVVSITAETTKNGYSRTYVKIRQVRRSTNEVNFFLVTFLRQEAERFNQCCKRGDYIHVLCSAKNTIRDFKNVSDYVVTNFERVCWSEDDKRFVAIKIAG